MLDYRETLRLELERRCSRNPRYSLRAFARDLGLSASRVSEAMNERRGLSEAAAELIVRRLGMPSFAGDCFMASVAAQHARSAARRRTAQEHLERLHAEEKPLARHVEPAAYIVAWYYGAIVELARLPACPADPAWVARRLRLTEFQVVQALRYLKRKSFVQEAAGRLMPGAAAGQPLRLAYEQVLAKAAEAQSLQPVDGDGFLALHLALDARRLAQAHRLTRTYLQSLAALTEKATEATSVHLLAVQLFRADTPL